MAWVWGSRLRAPRVQVRSQKALKDRLDLGISQSVTGRSSRRRVKQMAASKFTGSRCTPTCTQKTGDTSCTAADGQREGRTKQSSAHCLKMDLSCYGGEFKTTHSQRKSSEKESPIPHTVDPRATEKCWITAVSKLYSLRTTTTMRGRYYSQRLCLVSILCSQLRCHETESGWLSSEAISCRLHPSSASIPPQYSPSLYLTGSCPHRHRRMLNTPRGEERRLSSVPTLKQHGSSLRALSIHRPPSNLLASRLQDSGSCPLSASLQQVSPAICPRACYAMSGTETAHGTTTRGVGSSSLLYHYRSSGTPAYAPATRCTVLIYVWVSQARGICDAEVPFAAGVEGGCDAQVPPSRTLTP